MKRFSAQFLITGLGAVLKQAVVTTDDEGTILRVEDTGGELKEGHSIEFYNGIIIPGFVNCHCHLELSHLKGTIASGIGLGSFIEQIRYGRNFTEAEIVASASEEDNNMFEKGTSLCADICNTSHTFELKKESKIKYINLLEVFGIDPSKADKRMDELSVIRKKAMDLDLPCSLVPHSLYSMSLTLLRLLRKKSEHNQITSVHFMESESEATFLESHSGPIMTSYKNSGLIPGNPETVADHAAGILKEITPSGNLILVHNTFTDRETIKKVMARKNLYWCICPDSNKYIESSLPPVTLLREERCEIVIGTDSLASNQKLDILSELISLQLNFPDLTIEELVRWATINGAKALGEDDVFGTIEPGKKPGILLIQNVDLQNLKLLPGSFVTRLI